MINNHQLCWFWGPKFVVVCFHFFSNLAQNCISTVAQRKKQASITISVRMFHLLCFCIFPYLYSNMFMLVTIYSCMTFLCINLLWVFACMHRNNISLSCRAVTLWYQQTLILSIITSASLWNFCFKNWKTAKCEKVYSPKINFL